MGCEFPRGGGQGKVETLKNLSCKICAMVPTREGNQVAFMNE